MFRLMTAPGNDALMAVLLVAFVASTGYAAGRIHQWYRTSLERDQAYRDGYDTATRSLFSLAARIVRPRRSDKPAVRGTASVSSILEAPGAGAGGGTTGAGASGRHTVPDELVAGPTYRLTPDRLARVKAPQQGEQSGDVTTKLTVVPKPRAS